MEDIKLDKLTKLSVSELNFDRHLKPTQCPDDKTFEQRARELHTYRGGSLYLACPTCKKKVAVDANVVDQVGDQLQGECPICGTLVNDVYKYEPGNLQPWPSYSQDRL